MRDKETEKKSTEVVCFLFVEYAFSNCNSHNVALHALECC
jgi:hypothetical protein